MCEKCCKCCKNFEPVQDETYAIFAYIHVRKDEIHYIRLSPNLTKSDAFKLFEQLRQINIQNITCKPFK